MTNLQPLHDLEGLIDNGTGVLLYNLAREVPGNQAIVEIGSYHGKSTAYLAQGARDGNSSPVFAVDPWEQVDVKKWCRHCEQPTFAKFKAQLELVGLFDAVTPMRLDSAHAADQYEGGPIGLLFIDGDHSEEACFRDFILWVPDMAPNAVVVFDDYAVTKNPGVAKAVNRLMPEFVPGTFQIFGRLAISKVR